MSLREFFQRHRNVFSFSTKWVDAGSEAVGTLKGEYGDQATETIDGSNPTWLGTANVGWTAVRPRVQSTRTSVDGILEIGEDGADAEKPAS